MLPNSAIIGVNVSAALIPADAPNWNNMQFVFAFEESQEHLYFFYRNKNVDRLAGDAFRVVHFRWGRA